ncbi:PREDICTED: filaggrin-like [Rhinopithecus bieti]|uniref:filaggrin-like n=1 Tax=Rhinopithecus bieti TaxID=61621 RepID=UPI00083C6FF3|nr:PREDICTED: filaggrin-like [Rhinopithecus bieti]
MSTLLENIFAIINLFKQYSKKDKNTDTLSKKELKELLEKEFRLILKNPDDPDTVEVFMDHLDIDHNKKIDFTEFLLMVFKLAQAYYESTRKQNLPTSGHKHRKHSHHDKHEDNKEEENKEKRKRPLSLERRNNRKGNTGRSKSPRETGGKRHESGSEKKERKGYSPTHREEEYGQNHHKSSKKEKNKAEITRLEHNGKRISERPEEKEEKEDGQYDYENTGRMNEKWTESGHAAIYYAIQDEADDITDNILEENRRYETSRSSHDESSHRVNRSRHANTTQVPLVECRRRTGQGSSVSQDSEIEGHSEDSERRSGLASRNHHESVQKQSRDGSRHHGSHQEDRAGHRNSADSSRQSGSRHTETSSRGQAVIP